MEACSAIRECGAVTNTLFPRWLVDPSEGESQTGISTWMRPSEKAGLSQRSLGVQDCTTAEELVLSVADTLLGGVPIIVMVNGSRILHVDDTDIVIVACDKDHEGSDPSLLVLPSMDAAKKWTETRELLEGKASVASVEVIFGGTSDAFMCDDVTALAESRWATHTSWSPWLIVTDGRHWSLRQRGVGSIVDDDSPDPCFLPIALGSYSIDLEALGEAVGKDPLASRWFTEFFTVTALGDCDRAPSILRQKRSEYASTNAAILEKRITVAYEACCNALACDGAFCDVDSGRADVPKVQGAAADLLLRLVACLMQESISDTEERCQETLTRIGKRSLSPDNTSNGHDLALSREVFAVLLRGVSDPPPSKVNLADLQLDAREAPAADVAECGIISALMELLRVDGDTSGDIIDYRFFNIEDLSELFHLLLDVPTPDAGSSWFSWSKRTTTKSGIERQRTGAFYTPVELVHRMVFDAFEDACISSRLADANDSLESLFKELSGIRVMDPTVGSGRFVLAAFRELVARVSGLIAMHGETSFRKNFQDACALIADNCIFGVDIHPAAVSVTRFAIRAQLAEWVPSRTTKMINWHIVHGNSLTGCFDTDSFSGGIADEKTRSRFCALFLPRAVDRWGSLHKALRCTTDDDVLYAWRRSRLFRSAIRAADGAACASLGVPVPVPAECQREPSGWDEEFSHMLHWCIAFPDVFFGGGGFSIMLGNPPWIQLQNPNAFKEPERSERKALLKHSANASMFPVTNTGNMNTYSMVMQRAVLATRPGGVMSLVLPMSIISEPKKSLIRKFLLEELDMIQMHHVPLGKFASKAFAASTQAFVVVHGRRVGGTIERTVDHDNVRLFRPPSFNLWGTGSTVIGTRQDIISCDEHRFLLSPPLGFRKVHVSAIGVCEGPLLGDIMRKMPTAVTLMTGEGDEKMRCSPGASPVDLFKFQTTFSSKPFRTVKRGGWPHIGQEGYIMCVRLLGLKGVSSRPVRACVVPNDIRSDENANSMALRDPPDPTHPSDPYFFCAILNSFITEASHSVSGGPSTVSRDFTRGIVVPGFRDVNPNVESDMRYDASGTRVSTGGHSPSWIFRKICDLVDPSHSSVQRRPELTGLSIKLSDGTDQTLPPCSRVLADVISAGAKRCGKSVPTRTNVGRLAPYAWDAKTGWTPHNTWLTFRKGDTVLNHLVARWYSLTDEEFDSFSTRVGHHTETVYAPQRALRNRPDYHIQTSEIDASASASAVDPAIGSKRALTVCSSSLIPSVSKRGRRGITVEPEFTVTDQSTINGKEEE